MSGKGRDLPLSYAKAFTLSKNSKTQSNNTRMPPQSLIIHVQRLWVDLGQSAGVMTATKLICLH